MLIFTTLHMLLPNGDGVPEWVHLVPAGTFSGTDGRGPYRLDDPAAVIAASMAAGKLALDENHSTDLAGPNGQPAPARGWVVGACRMDAVRDRADDRARLSRAEPGFRA